MSFQAGPHLALLSTASSIDSRQSLVADSVHASCIRRLSMGRYALPVPLSAHDQKDHSAKGTSPPTVDLRLYISTPSAQDCTGIEWQFFRCSRTSGERDGIVQAMSTPPNVSSKSCRVPAPSCQGRSNESSIPFVQDLMTRTCTLHSVLCRMMAGATDRFTA